MISQRKRPDNARGVMGYKVPGGIKKLDELDLAEQDISRCQAAVEQNGRKRAFFTEYRDRPIVGVRRLKQLAADIAKLEKLQEQEIAKLSCASLMVDTCNSLDAGLVENLSTAQKKYDDLLAARRKARASELLSKRSSEPRKPRSAPIDTETQKKLASAGFDLNFLQKVLRSA